MTRSSMRGRPGRARDRISARLALSLLGGVIALLWLWLVLPTMTSASDAPAARGAGAVAVSREDDTSTADLALPLVVAVAAVAGAAYTWLRRSRRTRSRTTPGGTPTPEPPAPPLSELDERARALLVEADDSVRTGRAELGFAAARLDPSALEPFTRALHHAETELAAAFAIRQRYEDGVPEEESARRQALTGIAGRCTEAGRLLDDQAAALDAARAAEPGGALEVVESRFRELTARIVPAERTLADLAHRYAPGATGPVTGFVEQARDRLAVATLRINQARQQADLGEPDRAAGHRRAAEGAVAQAAVLLDAVERLAADLTAADDQLRTALTGTETELEAIRRDLSSQAPHDPLALLRRVVRTVPLPPATELLATGSIALTDAYVDVHRAALSAAPRTHLATAQRLLTQDHLAAEETARAARQQAEQEATRATST